MVSSTASWDMHPESEWRGAGVAVADGTNPITLPDGADDSNLVMYHWDDTARHVQTEEELREALADEDTALVVLEGEGPLTPDGGFDRYQAAAGRHRPCDGFGEPHGLRTGAFLRGGLDLGVGTPHSGTGGHRLERQLCQLRFRPCFRGLAGEFRRAHPYRRKRPHPGRAGKLGKSWLPPFPGGSVGCSGCIPFLLGMAGYGCQHPGGGGGGPREPPCLRHPP